MRLDKSYSSKNVFVKTHIRPKVELFTQVEHKASSTLFFGNHANCFVWNFARLQYDM